MPILGRNLCVFVVSVIAGKEFSLGTRCQFELQPVKVASVTELSAIISVFVAIKSALQGTFPRTRNSEIDEIEIDAQK